MQLIRAAVGPFKSIETPVDVVIDPKVTVLVGMNEAGKTAFLQALHKSRSVDGSDEFRPTEDYPRRSLTTYQKTHKEKPANVTRLTYQLTPSEIAEINDAIGVGLPDGFTFHINHQYDNTTTIEVDVDSKAVLKALLANAVLSSDAKGVAKAATDLRDLAKRLEAIERTEADDAFLTTLKKRIENSSWVNVVANEVWRTYLSRRIPAFLYFDDYHLLPGKMNLADLVSRAEQGKTNPSMLETQHKGVLALLRMADIEVNDLTNPEGYESIKAKLEGISNSITDQVFAFWKQNENLEVEFDIRADPTDNPPYNNGANLYIRIKNKRHRVTVPFDQRSKGFIWFFSFLVWFDSIQQQISHTKGKASKLVLLLDEPGLSLHALAQADFLVYIEGLSNEHQVIYTTHSPFMVQSDRLDRVRVVEDRDAVGTTISDNVSGSSARTLFPLQAALGYTIAQNLFISKRNLLVEGPADLIYLQFVSDLLEAGGGEGLRDDVTIVPTGGLDKVATFVALLGANQLELVVLHDSTGSPDMRITGLVRDKILPQKVVLTYADARGKTTPRKGTAATTTATVPTDVEDLFTVAEYLALFNEAFAARLPRSIAESDLPGGDRIVDRLNRYLATEGISLRPSGGFNHYTVAAHLAAHPITSLDPSTKQRFETLLTKVNGLFSTPDANIAE